MLAFLVCSREVKFFFNFNFSLPYPQIHFAQCLRRNIKKVPSHGVFNRSVLAFNSVLYIPELADLATPPPSCL